MSKKIVFIGAGSYGFTFKLVADLLYIDNMKENTFVFMDIDRERLDNLKTLLDYYFKKVGYEKPVEYTTNRKEALTGASFIINLVKIGMMEACYHDMDIAKPYGLFQTIGDTSCLGGIFRGVRTMIFDIQMCKEIKEVSTKDAIVLNYSNPQATSVMAASATSKVPFIGLCHSVQGTTHQLANLLGERYEDINYEAAGINHMAWILKLEKDGVDLYPRVKQIVKERGIFFEYEDGEMIMAKLGPARLDMLNRMGYMVTESSTHFPEYVPFYLRTEELRQKYKIPVDQYKKNIANKEIGHNKLMEQVAKGELAIKERSVEYGSQIIEAMLTNKPCKIYANVMNKGLITNLPAFSAVEVPCLVDRNGVTPCYVGDLPAQLAMLCNMEINSHQMVANAILKKDKEFLVYALMADPATHSVMDLDQMKSVAYELVELEKEYLDGWFE